MELSPDGCRVGQGGNASAAVDGARDGGHARHKFGAEHDAGIAEHALLKHAAMTEL